LLTINLPGIDRPNYRMVAWSSCLATHIGFAPARCPRVLQIFSLTHPVRENAYPASIFGSDYIS
ncbi:MAG: hypothetical protein WAU04_10750, partial [Candidatus Nitrotoga sp.]